MRDPRLYNSISSTYRTTRRQDDRVAAVIHAALGQADRIVNIGAGTGNYEPRGRSLLAVEPSRSMIADRPPGSNPVVQATAENLPFPPKSFQAAMATLTLHHWQDRARGLEEMKRVAARQVIFMFDPAAVYRFWAVKYWPGAVTLPSERDLPRPVELGRFLDLIDIQTVPVPFDCTDGFGAAFWGRPEAYLSSDVQQGMSWLAQLPAADLAKGASKLEADLRSGEWDRRFGELRQLDQLDVGYRLVVAGT